MMVIANTILKIRPIVSLNSARAAFAAASVAAAVLAAVLLTTYQLGLFWLRGLACFFGAFGHDDVGLRFFGRCGLVRVSCKITLQTVFGTYIVTALFRLLFVFVQRDHNSPIKQVF
jgi:hypothetical protein